MSRAQPRLPALTGREFTLNLGQTAGVGRLVLTDDDEAQSGMLAHCSAMCDAGAALARVQGVRVAVTERGIDMQGLGLKESDEESLKALNLIIEAWEEGTETGIAPAMMAYAALYTALTDLVASFGEGEVVRLVEGLKPRLERGEFTLYRSRQ